jgi:hypothetical protein
MSLVLCCIFDNREIFTPTASKWNEMGSSLGESIE